MKFTTSDAPTTQPKPLPKTLKALRTEALMHVLAGVGVVVGTGMLVAKTNDPRLSLLALIALILFIQARWLWSDTLRLAEQLPQRPERKTPPHWMRVWWWLRSRPPKVKARPMPYRPVKVNDGSEVRMPRQPGEMRQEIENVVVAGYTASDVYYIVCRAASVGLAERNWQFGDGQRLTLPSGAQLSRDGFRAVQGWLVEHKHATAKPSYTLLATPEAILEQL